MKPTLCSKCKKNLAVVFITKIENGQTNNEGYCLKCARELGIKPVDDMISRMGLSDEDLDNLNGEMLDTMNGLEGLISGAQNRDDEPEEDEEETDYEPTPEEIRELEEEEELGAYYPDGNPDFATGYSFDDLKKVRRVLVSDDAGEKAEREAREVLPSVMGSDIWEAMLDEFEGARERVARLMDNHNV